MLSKILSLTIEHNNPRLTKRGTSVVNCFQKSYLWLLNTTWLHKERCIKRCELLSKILSLTIEHNGAFNFFVQQSVVNCFQKSYLWLLNTTTVNSVFSGVRLWIAFKNLIFDYWTQHVSYIFSILYSCELLSKILSLTIEHNMPQYSVEVAIVVNCFQKSYLWLLNTTISHLPQGRWELWIAFKNLIFDYWTQLLPWTCVMMLGCELLSKILSLTIEHNSVRYRQQSLLVVNCFQKSYLWLLNTTEFHVTNDEVWLWIAFKNLIFDYWTQLDRHQ